jgi:hypothetical protein
MATGTVPTESRGGSEGVTNGSAVAAFLAAGIGAFALGLVVLLNEAGIFAAPTLYGPAGGVSGRTTLGVIAWLVAWGVLHSRWHGREMASRRIYALTLLLVGLGVLATFPPVWGLLGMFS